MLHPPTLIPVLRYVFVMLTGSSRHVTFHFARSDNDALMTAAPLHVVDVYPDLVVLNDLISPLSDASVEYSKTGDTVIYHLHPCTVDNTEQYNKLLEHVDHIMKDGAK